MKIKTGGGRIPEKPPKFGGIKAGVMYRRDEVMSLLGIGAAGFRQMVAAGMKVGRIGKRAYVMGEDVIAAVSGQKTGGIRVVFEGNNEDQAAAMAELLLHLLQASERKVDAGESEEPGVSNEDVERLLSEIGVH
jgi:hypothetical protein